MTVDWDILFQCAIHFKICSRLIVFKFIEQNWKFKLVRSSSTQTTGLDVAELNSTTTQEILCFAFIEKNDTLNTMHFKLHSG